ncbi:MAG: hypothetical protein ACRENE_20895 [Polyangiaceae bacterium]
MQAGALQHSLAKVQTSPVGQPPASAPEQVWKQTCAFDAVRVHVCVVEQFGVPPLDDAHASANDAKASKNKGNRTRSAMPRTSSKAENSTITIAAITSASDADSDRPTSGSLTPLASPVSCRLRMQLIVS